jgi:hypothetical protein
MIDFLLVSGIKKQTIDKIKENPSNAYDLSINKEECVKIITYLRLIGINNVDELLLNRLGLFFKTKEEVAQMFINHDLNRMVELINDDLSNIDLLFE